MRESDKAETLGEREVIGHRFKDRFLMWCKEDKAGVVRVLRSRKIIHQVVPLLEMSRKVL